MFVSPPNVAIGHPHLGGSNATTASSIRPLWNILDTPLWTSHTKAQHQHGVSLPYRAFLRQAKPSTFCLIFETLCLGQTKYFLSSATDRPLPGKLLVEAAELTHDSHLIKTPALVLPQLPQKWRSRASRLTIVQDSACASHQNPKKEKEAPGCLPRWM